METKNDKKLLLYKEINMEILSLSLQRLLICKKNKQGDLRIENCDISAKLKEYDSVVSYDI